MHREEGEGLQSSFWAHSNPWAPGISFCTHGELATSQSGAKAGVVDLVRDLTVELAREGVRVDGVASGYIRMAQVLSEEHSLSSEELEQAAKFIPLGG
jgi:NAD(P)-dependent dehydrogenase (short-subunit alcohol dehydrogenase family)